MSKRVLAGRSLSGKGRTSGCAVAGAEDINWTESVSDRAHSGNFPATAGRLVPGHARRAGQQRRRRRADDEWLVQIDLPVTLRTNAAELIALDAYLGREIDAILATPPRMGLSRRACANLPLAPGFKEPL
ncbi:MAG: hypothetical protein EON54_15060 [Alcaligenaceae bacterium]|nr:MAG: hypothetical protein EON54_15060 [Alcaligenaceae bacterium]